MHKNEVLQILFVFMSNKIYKINTKDLYITLIIINNNKKKFDN